MALLTFLIEVFKSSIVSTRKLSKEVEVIIDPLFVESGDFVHSELTDIL